jgi:hypothetical protein
MMLTALLAICLLRPSTDDVKLNHARDLHRQLSELLRLEPLDLEKFSLDRTKDYDKKLAATVAAGQLPVFAGYSFYTPHWGISLDARGNLEGIVKYGKGGAALPGDDNGALKVAEIIFGKQVTFEFGTDKRSPLGRMLRVRAIRAGYTVGKIGVGTDPSGVVNRIIVDGHGLPTDFIDICDANPAPSREQALTWANRHIKERVKAGADGFTNLGVFYGVRPFLFKRDPSIVIPAATMDRLMQGKAVPLIGAGFENKALKRWIKVLMDARDGSLLTFIEDDLYPIGN